MTRITTATKLTLLRIVLVPVILLILYLDIPSGNWIALAVFIVASVSDAFDGYVARHYNQVTNLGKFMDPLADKMLVLSAMCWFVEAGRMRGWVLALVLLREFGVSGLRLVAAERGRVIAAGWSGKVKTAGTMVCLCAMLLLRLDWLDTLSSVAIAALTVISGVEYFAKNIDVFREKENLDTKK